MSERSKGACDKPVSMPQTQAYDDGYDRIFKKKPKVIDPEKEKKDDCISGLRHSMLQERSSNGK